VYIFLGSSEWRHWFLFDETTDTAATILRLSDLSDRTVDAKQFETSEKHLVDVSLLGAM